MKKHFSIVAIALMALVVTFGSCKKDPKPTPAPTEKEYTVTYQIPDTYQFLNPETFQYETKPLNISDCFSFEFTYIDADGKTVEVKDVKAPWSKSITVKAPFTAKMEGKSVYNENELPDRVTYSTHSKITVNTSSYKEGAHGTMTKENFLGHVSENALKISNSHEIQ